jgi:hypothetical protein
MSTLTKRQIDEHEGIGPPEVETAEARGPEQITIQWTYWTNTELHGFRATAKRSRVKWMIENPDDTTG